MASLYNFLDCKLLPKISSKSPATDNYEVENLISSNFREKAKGFIAYPSIKPPVEVEIHFICSVNIHYLSLNTIVGSQKCTGIEILAKDDSSDYVSICKRIYDQPGIVFCNSRKYSHKQLPERFNINFCLSFFKSDTFRTFLNACSIKIIIFKTDKSVPCLSSIEIWGTPSRTCSQVTIQTIQRLMSKTHEPSPLPTSKEEVETFCIPEDFKDDLTYEIMTIPMTLPSGKTVDQSTIEKHVKNEISFGRKPCDPFTGVKFNDNLKPVLNVALKSRIDMFLLQNSHREEFFRLTRMLGRGPVQYNVTNNFRKRKYDTETSGSSDNKLLCTYDSKNSCVMCKKDFEYLYEIPCLHFHCRSCLLKIKERFVCSYCGKIFSNNEICKLNF